MSTEPETPTPEETQESVVETSPPVLFWVKKHPYPDTLCVVLCKLPSDANPEEWEQMTAEHIEEWKAAEIANGWTPQAVEAPPAPLRQEADVVLQRLTEQERQALFAARNAHWQIDYFITRAASTGVISADDPDFSNATAALDQMGIIAAIRWPVLLAP